MFVTQRGHVSLAEPKGPESSRTLFSQANQTSQSTLLLQKKKEMNEVQMKLDRKREEFNERMQRCQQKELELAGRQQNIREQVVKFDKFLRENDAKRARANKKASEEIKLREQREQEIVVLQQQLEELRTERERCQVVQERSARYERYLMEVTETSDEFPEINDILMRHATLTAANSDLRQSVRQDLEKMEKYRNELNNFIKEAQNEILLHNNEIATRQKQLEGLKNRNAKLEQTYAERENVNKQRARTLGEIKMALHNLYGRARVKHYQEDADITEKLRMIQQRMLDYQDVLS